MTYNRTILPPIFRAENTLRTALQTLKAPLHDTIRPPGAYRLPCTWVNRNVWHVARMSRTRKNRVKRNYSSFYFRADSAARAVRVPNQSAAHQLASQAALTTMADAGSVRLSSIQSLEFIEIIVSRSCSFVGRKQSPI